MSSAASAHPQRHLPRGRLVRATRCPRCGVGQGLVEEVRSRAGRIDALINNAGVNLVGAVEETSIGQAQALFDTNVIGVLRMIHAVLPDMRRQGAMSRGRPRMTSFRPRLRCAAALATFGSLVRIG